MYHSSETIIQITYNLIGGAKADKGDRKKLVIVTDLLAALICCILSFFVDTGYMASVMILANALLAVAETFLRRSKKLFRIRKSKEMYSRI